MLGGSGPLFIHCMASSMAAECVERVKGFSNRPPWLGNGKTDWILDGLPSPAESRPPTSRQLCSTARHLICACNIIYRKCTKWMNNERTNKKNLFQTLHNPLLLSGVFFSIDTSSRRKELLKCVLLLFRWNFAKQGFSGCGRWNYWVYELNQLNGSELWQCCFFGWCLELSSKINYWAGFITTRRILILLF